MCRDVDCLFCAGGGARGGYGGVDEGTLGDFLVCEGLDNCGKMGRVCTRGEAGELFVWC
jgi:hypothetical protein